MPVDRERWWIHAIKQSFGMSEEGYLPSLDIGLDSTIAKFLGPLFNVVRKGIRRYVYTTTMETSEEVTNAMVDMYAGRRLGMELNKIPKGPLRDLIQAGKVSLDSAGERVLNEIQAQGGNQMAMNIVRTAAWQEAVTDPFVDESVGIIDGSIDPTEVLEGGKVSSSFVADKVKALVGAKASDGFYWFKEKIMIATVSEQWNSTRFGNAFKLGCPTGVSYDKSLRWYRHPSQAVPGTTCVIPFHDPTKAGMFAMKGPPNSWDSIPSEDKDLASWTSPSRKVPVPLGVLEDRSRHVSTNGKKMGLSMVALMASPSTDVAEVETLETENHKLDIPVTTSKPDDPGPANPTSQNPAASAVKAYQKTAEPVKTAAQKLFGTPEGEDIPWWKRGIMGGGK